MRRVVAILLIFFVLPLTLLAQSKRGPSTAEERQRAIAVAKNLVEDPLTPANKDDARWLTIWLIEVPDITVSICTATLPWEKKYKYGGELMGAEMGTMAKYAIEHPDKAGDKVASGLAALEAALHAYSKILEAKPSEHSKQMDEVLKIEAAGGLADYVKQQWDKQGCK